MHDTETRALRRAALTLLAISLLRWAWSAPVEPVGGDESALPELLAESRTALKEEERRDLPLAEGERLDPNRADEIELDRLPGIGPATAEAIVQARDSGIVFRRPDDLLVVRGIGPAAVERLRPSIDLGALSPGSDTRSGPATNRRTIIARSRFAPERAASPGPSVDVNRADAEELQSLPGVGPALAERIIAERQEQLFTSVDDLARVRGIGPATVERLRGFATVGR